MIHIYHPCLGVPFAKISAPACTGLGKRTRFPSCLNRPWKTERLPLAFTGQGEAKQKSSLPQPAKGKQSTISSLPSPAKGKQSKICSRVSSELSCPDRVSTSSHPPAKSGPKFACTSVASSPGSEQCANFPPSTLQRLLQGSNEPSASAKV